MTQEFMLALISGGIMLVGFIVGSVLSKHLDEKHKLTVIIYLVFYLMLLMFIYKG